ncbi:hypothetical protein F511_38829 [Dorcoceras hygrometricum]|uniref:Uncharacterized protein n=1 Tax=Dorcoceras hygrometricum TaxID=472368 RepID=A0A2Z7A448_9LAMI|nr:hypothetical protein F511_38829 [Dorcoceras hygrometricum]
MLAAGCPVVGREMLATGFPNDCSHLDVQATCWFLAQNHLLNSFVFALLLNPSLQEPSAESYEGKTLSYQLMQTTSFCNRQLQTPTAGCTATGYFFAPADLYRSSSILRLFLASVPAGPFAPADLSSSAEHDVVTDYIIIDGPLRCSSWFSFDVPAGPSSSSSACNWLISFQLIYYAPAGST